MKRATQYVLVLVLFFAAWVVALQQVPHYAHALPKPQAVMSIVKIVRAPGARGPGPFARGRFGGSDRWLCACARAWSCQGGWMAH